jgi:NTE family protein
MGNGELPIYLALSGGGTRAMAFHLGVLQYLAKIDALDRVKKISTVSGGSLLIGLLLKKSNYKWPTKEEFEEQVFESVRSELLSETLLYKLFARRLLPNLRTGGIRGHWLGRALMGVWGIDRNLSELPKSPSWVINATSAETGKRFYFSEGKLRSYEVGSINAEDFSIATAIATSAGFPGGIGPWVLKRDELSWEKKTGLVRSMRKLHLYDGGIYDNLGLEEFINVGYGLKDGLEDGIVIASDAGKSLAKSFTKMPINPLRFQDLFNMSADQVRSLRVRDFSAMIERRSIRGTHLRLGKGRGKANQELSIIKTSLNGFEESTLNRLVDHGFESMKTSCIL